MKETTKLTRRQFVAMSFVSLLSPVIRILPKESVLTSGELAWLSCLLAFVPAFALMAFMVAFQKSYGGIGMCGIFMKALGGWAGRIFLGIYALWMLLYAGFVLRSSADRFISTVYPSSSVYVFMIIMVLLALLAALSRLKVLSRTAEVFRPILILVTGLVLAFSLGTVDINYLIPNHSPDIPKLLLGALPAAGVAGFVAYFSFLEHQVDTASFGAKPFLPWMIAIILFAVLLCATTVGNFGASMVARLNNPFFVMIRGVTLFSILERIEAVIIAFWVFTDFVLLGSVLHIALACIETIAGNPAGKKFRPVVSCASAVAALAVGIYMADTAFDLISWSQFWIPLLNLIFIFGGFPLVWLVGVIRKAPNK